jgi:hypothetical protein
MTSNDPSSLRDIFEERAQAGDAGFAIAYALLEIADAQYAVRDALDRLGNGNASTQMGAIENLAGKVSGLAIALDGIGTNIADAINSTE